MTTSPAAPSSPRSVPASPPPPCFARSPARRATRSPSRRSAVPPGAGRRSSRTPTSIGYAALELRGIAGEMDLPKVPEFVGTRLAEDEEGPRRPRHRRERSRRVRAHAREGPGRPRAAVRRGPALHRPGAGDGREVRPDVRRQDPRGRAQGRGDEAGRRGLPDDGRLREAGRRHGADRIARRLHALGGPRGHPDPRRRRRSSRCSGTRTTRSSPAKEQPADTFAKIGKWTRHTHLKDSKPEGADRRYVLLGAGEVPVKEQVGVLAAGRLQGLLLLRVGEEVAPGDRGARGRVPALREDDGRVPRGRRRQGRVEADVQERTMSRTRRSAGASSWRRAARSWAPSPRCRRCCAAATGGSAPRPIPRRTLGRTGVSVSILAMGCGSRFLACTRRSRPRRCSRRPSASASTTSTPRSDYGNGESETRVGRFLATRRTDVFLATKVPPGARTRDAALRGGRGQPQAPADRPRRPAAPARPRRRGGPREDRGRRTAR